MRYIRFERWRTAFYEDTRKVHEIKYARHAVGSDAAMLRRQHITQRAELLQWEEWQEIRCDVYYYTEDNRQFFTFRDALSHAKTLWAMKVKETV